MSAGTEADVDRVERAARSTFEDGRWAGASPWHRAAVVLRFAELIGENLEEPAPAQPASRTWGRGRRRPAAGARLPLRGVAWSTAADDNHPLFPLCGQKTVNNRNKTCGGEWS